MAFNGFPYTNFADLNLDWLLSRVQDVIALVNSANSNADNAVEVATEANERTLTYAQQIAAAVADAEEALNLAQDAQDILVIYPDNEGKPVNYKKYINGETEYIGTAEILTELTLYKRIPFFMDRNQNVFILNGILDSGTSNSKVRFTRAGGSSTFFAIIDSNQTITYTSSESGGEGAFPVTIHSYQSSGDTTCDKTFAEISEAYEDGMTVQCHVIDEIHGVEFYAYETKVEESSNNQKLFSWYSPYYDTINGYYRAFLRDDELCNIGVSRIPDVQEIVWGYEGEDGGNAVIRKRSDNSIYTASQMVTDYNARKLILIETDHGVYYLSGTFTVLGVSMATFTNGYSYTMTVSGNGQYAEFPFGTQEITDTDTTIQTNIDPNRFYVFPNAGQLTIDFNSGISGIVNEYHFRFTSGSTATQLDIPAAVNIPDDFEVVANTVYEVSIIDNFMVYSSWAVTA